MVHLRHAKAKPAELPGATKPPPKDAMSRACRVATPDGSRGLQSTVPGSAGNVSRQQHRNPADDLPRRVRLWPDSAVTTRRGCAFRLTPWVKTHGYRPVSLRDTRAIFFFKLGLHRSAAAFHQAIENRLLRRVFGGSEFGMPLHRHQPRMGLVRQCLCRSVRCPRHHC